jgi:hypothetical protein
MMSNKGLKRINNSIPPILIPTFFITVGSGKLISVFNASFLIPTIKKVFSSFVKLLFGFLLLSHQAMLKFEG